MIIEEQGAIDFVKRNLQINENIVLQPYRDASEVPAIMMDSDKKIPMITTISVHSIQPSSSGASLFDVFKEHLLLFGKYQDDHHLYQMLRKHVDFMVGFEKTGIRYYRFSQIAGPVNPVYVFK
ncbi:hypothetical protein [Terrihalobacillus insolitus]|uniref:hypothetical protein n=1 Tax=Terrihalobacillus insolitus TaxID=2950438 RepID=UPI00233F8813|nr:hypothetical protein [Terrihalobacillus insolitus]